MATAKAPPPPFSSTPPDPWLVLRVIGGPDKSLTWWYSARSTAQYTNNLAFVYFMAKE